MKEMVEKFRILVVDDDETIRTTLQLALEEEGYIVDTAQNGREAVGKSQSNFFNLAIVDWRLPDIEGTRLLSNLKETVPKMAKIMLTGYPSMKNAIDSVNSRADAFFEKPVGIAELVKKINELLALQQGEKKYSEAKMTEYIETRVKELRRTQAIKPKQ